MLLMLLIPDTFDAGYLGGFVAEIMLCSLIIFEWILAISMIYRLPTLKKGVTIAAVLFLEPYILQALALIISHASILPVSTHCLLVL